MPLHTELNIIVYLQHKNVAVIQSYTLSSEELRFKSGVLGHLGSPAGTSLPQQEV